MKIATERSLSAKYNSTAEDTTFPPALSPSKTTRIRWQESFEDEHGSKKSSGSHGTTNNKHTSHLRSFGSSTALDQFKEYEFHTVRQRLTWSFELPDSPLRDEYIAFYIDKTSMGWLLFSTVAMVVTIFSVSLFIVIDTSQLLYEAQKYVDTTNGLLDVVWYWKGKLTLELFRLLCSVTGTIAGSYLCYVQRDSLFQLLHDLWDRVRYTVHGTDPHNNVSFADTVSTSTLGDNGASHYETIPSSEGTSNPNHLNENGQPLSSIEINLRRSMKTSLVRTVRHYFIFAYEIVFLIPIVQRTIFTPDCNIFNRDTEGFSLNFHNDSLEQSTCLTYQGGTHCGDYGTKSSGFQGNMFGMAFLVLVFLTNFPDINLKLLWAYLLTVSTVCSFCAAWIGAYDAIPVAIVICMAVGLVIIDVSVRNIVVFLTTKKLKKLIVETERSAEQAHAIEMRHMIANVAHDLKTVSYLSVIVKVIV